MKPNPLPIPLGHPVACSFLSTENNHSCIAENIFHVAFATQTSRGKKKTPLDGGMHGALPAAEEPENILLLKIFAGHRSVTRRNPDAASAPSKTAG
jgi:hypothetical protein